VDARGRRGPADPRRLSTRVVRPAGAVIGIDPENAKSPAMRGFSKCAEEDSNLHPVIPDQALKTVGA
jgi:hypothetical protein